MRPAHGKRRWKLPVQLEPARIRKCRRRPAARQTAKVRAERSTCSATRMEDPAVSARAGHLPTGRSSTSSSGRIRLYHPTPSIAAKRSVRRLERELMSVLGVDLITKRVRLPGRCWSAIRQKNCARETNYRNPGYGDCRDFCPRRRRTNPPCRFLCAVSMPLAACGAQFYVQPALLPVSAAAAFVCHGGDSEFPGAHQVLFKERPSRRRCARFDRGPGRA